MQDTPFGNIPDDWGLDTINDACEVVTDYVANGSFKSLADNVVYQDHEDSTVLIRLVDYNNGFNGNFVYVNDHAYEFLAKSKLFGDEIIISNVGANVGTVFRCPHLDKQMTLGPNSVMLKFKQNDDFYFYWLKSPAGQHMLQSIVTGSAQPKFNKTNLRQVIIPVPPEDVQKKIADILLSIDNKIDNNNQINRNLSEQAETLFRSWFEAYEPWNGEMPTDWKQGVLGDFVTIKRGGSPRPIQEYLSDEGLRWLKISDVSGLQSPYVLEIAEHIIEAGLKKTVYLEAGSLVLSNSATPGIPKILDVDSCIHDGWLYFPESQLSNYFLYLFYKSIRPKLVALGNGSVFTNLKTDILKGYSFSKPDDDTLYKFDKIVAPMFRMMREVARENQRLSEVRDSLLPKLMSGELDVSDLNI